MKLDEFEIRALLKSERTTETEMMQFLKFLFPDWEPENELFQVSLRDIVQALFREWRKI